MNNPSYYGSSTSSSSRSLTTNPSPVDIYDNNDQRRIITINENDLRDYGIMTPAASPSPPAPSSGGC